MTLPIDQPAPKISKEGPSKVILIVEDNPFMRNSLCDLIGQSHPACTLLQANCAEKALELVANQAPDLVLMDIALPGMDGLTCLAEIKKQYPATRSVVISYHEEAPYVQRAKESGADAYVAKRRLYLDLAPLLNFLLYPEITGQVDLIRARSS
jgi:DNA-binding NarL/FixJ family response regulator